MAIAQGRDAGGKSDTISDASREAMAIKMLME
jgi:hypothetical protein